MSSGGEMGETTAVRTDYRGLIWPFAAVGALLLAWTVWWFVAAGQVERRAEETLADLRARGWIAEVSGLSVRGWPFRLFVTTTEARIVSPRGSGIAASFLQRRLPQNTSVLRKKSNPFHSVRSQLPAGSAFQKTDRPHSGVSRASQPTRS